MFAHIAGFGFRFRTAWAKWSDSEFEEMLDSEPDVELQAPLKP